MKLISPVELRAEYNKKLSEEDFENKNLTEKDIETINEIIKQRFFNKWKFDKNEDTVVLDDYEYGDCESSDEDSNLNSLIFLYFDKYSIKFGDGGEKVEAIKKYLSENGYEIHSKKCFYGEKLMITISGGVKNIEKII